MKIASVDTSLLQHRLARPAGPASVLNEWRRNLLVRITTDTGLVGWGETAPMAGVGTPMVEFDVTENPFASGLLHAPLPLVDGCFEVPDTPGLGLDLNLEAIRALEVPRNG